MNDVYSYFQGVTLSVCIWSLGFLGVFLLMVWTGMFNELCKKWCGISFFDKAFVIISVSFMTLTGATKGWTISFDGGIKQNEVQPSMVTNNLVEIHWMRDTSQGVLVPLDATVYIDYKTIGDTNAVWQTLGETTVGAWQYSAVLSNATNYNYSVWAYYIPPEPVHTNGVWIYKTLKDRRNENAIPLRARIEINGKAIATPAEKRKDEENE